MNPTATRSQQRYSEVFCSELPSPCNLFLSGKRCVNRRHRRRVPPPRHQQCGKKTVLSTPIMRFGADRHSLSLFQKSGSEGSGRARGDGYYLSAARLPSSASRKEEGKKAKKSSKTNVDQCANYDTTCLSQSSVFWNDDENSDCQTSCIEVFAMVKTPITENNNAKEQKLSSNDNNSLTTHESHTMSDTGKDTSGGDSSTIDNNAGGSLAKHKDGEGKSTLSSNYYLVVKSRVAVLLEQKTTHQDIRNQSTHHDQSNDDVLESKAEKPVMAASRTSSTVEIPLDYRPMAVHATELHISTKSQSSCSAIGIFVASADDNTLRLFVAEKDALQRKTTNKKGMSCFALVNDIATVPDEPDVPMTDENISKPLMFSTPIMSMDTCVTGKNCTASSYHPDQLKSDTVLNRLAIACYDGAVRILTYQLESLKQDRDGSDPPSLKFCHLQCSNFIVDGPVVALHFGVVNSPEPLPSPSPSLFLVAGSLCGFACVFYESALPSSSRSEGSSQSHSENFFDGPLTIVDGLYDARQDGYEDSVTSVHTNSCWAENQQMIVVGTQGGRVMVFGKIQKRNEDEVRNAKREKDELMNGIDKKEKELSQLDSEKVDMDGMAGDLNTIASEMQRKISELDTPEVHISEIAGVNVVGAEDENEPTNTDNNTSIQSMALSNEMSYLQTKLVSAQRELAHTQENIATHVSKMAQVSFALDDLRQTEQNINSHDCSMHAESMRKNHRYEFLWEQHLSYPIYGITSSTYRKDDLCAGQQEIFISTRRSFHVFKNCPPVGAVALLEEKLSKLLQLVP